MTDSFKVVNLDRESKQSFQEFLQLHLNEQTDRQIPLQENNFHSSKGNKKTIKHDNSEPCISLRDLQPENSDKSLVSMQSKIQLLITENSKLIEINSGLMREIEIMKQNNQSNRAILAQESQQKLMNYQQKVVQLTQANEQLSSRLIDEQNKNKRDMEMKLCQIIEDNHNLNEMLQTRLNDIDALNNQLIEKNNEIVLVNEEIKAINEKCLVLEQQKQVLIAQQQQYVDAVKDFQIKEQSLVQQLYQDQGTYQSCIQNLEQNYNIQINELRNSYMKEIEQQQEALAQQYQLFFNQQILTYQQQLKQAQQENLQLKSDLSERSKVWQSEKERLEELIKHYQTQNQYVKQQPQQEPIQQQQQVVVNQQQQINQKSSQQIQPQQQQQQQVVQNQPTLTQEEIDKQEKQKQYYEEILQIQNQQSQKIQQQIQQNHIQYQQNNNHHNSSNYTFRQNTQEDSREISPDKDDSIQHFEQKPRLHTESYGDRYDRTIQIRPPLVTKNYRVPQLQTLTRYDQKYYQQQPHAQQQYIQQAKYDNREYQRSLSQYQDKDDKQYYQQTMKPYQNNQIPKRY